ncbi:hypothetical protein [Paramuribaculum intestinale]|uniref:hypothetical protein n=1 Tax=Paramuribaculum intestinale TaxID=2094151 RepID=UPI0025AA0208|nr:hypothetical protein [Paramuribaculum intestinale]
MKKIMFSDKFGLTEAVLSGRKTQTRRVVPRSFFTCTHDILDDNTLVCEDMYGDWHDIRKTRYALQVGEVVAVAQSYHSFYNDECDPRMFPDGAGWTNKMFARADLMPFQIRITDVRVERLQDISDEDCIAEGIREVEVDNNWGKYATHTEYRIVYQDKYGREKLLIGMTPREAYAALIDRISGKGTWESNPYVFVYEFELIK